MQARLRTFSRGIWQRVSSKGNECRQILHQHLPFMDVDRNIHSLLPSVGRRIFSREKLLEGRSFEDMYVTGMIQEGTANLAENAAYVVFSELGCFDLELFEVQQFGDYYALEPK